MLGYEQYSVNSVNRGHSIGDFLKKMHIWQVRHHSLVNS